MPRKPKSALPSLDVAAVLQAGTWKASEVARLIDTPLAVVTRWAQTGVIPGCMYSGGAWRIPGRGLFFFLARRVECHYTPATVAAMLDKPEATIHTWMRSGRLRTVKLGLVKQASVLIPESSVIEFLTAEGRAS